MESEPQSVGFGGTEVRAPSGSYTLLNSPST